MGFLRGGFAVDLVSGGEDEDVVGGGFEVELEGGEPGVEVVHGDESDDGDAEACCGGDEGFADAAGDFFDGEFGAADGREGAHDAGDGAEEAEKGAEGDDGVHGAEEAAGGAEFTTGGDLEGAFHGGVGVIEAVVDHADDGVGGVGGALDGGGEVAGFEGFVDGVEAFGIAF